MSNPIPEGWEVSSIAELGKVVTGSTPSTKDQSYWGGEIPFVSPADFDGHVYVKQTQRTLTESGAKKGRLLPKDTILVTCIGSLGGIVMSPSECTTNQQINAVVTNSKNDPRYGYYNILHNIDELKKNAGTTTLPIINKSTFELIPLLSPPLPEQQKIAAILTAVDNVIESTQAQINKLQDLKTGMMQELLTKGFGHSEFKDSPVGRIPVGWEATTLSQHVLEKRSGASLKPTDFAKQGFEVIPKKGIQFGGKLIMDKKTYCTNEFAEHNPKTCVDNRFKVTVLRDLVPSGPSIGLIVTIDTEKTYLMAQGVYGFLLDSTLDGDFLCHLSNSDWYRREMKKILVGSTQVHIRSSEFFEILIPTPPIEEQRKIASVLGAIDQKIVTLKSKVQGVRNVKKAMMSDLLTGTVRVKAS